MGRNTHWTEPESMRLQEMAGDMPMDMLHRIWNGEACRCGWPRRTRLAIKEHLNIRGISVVPTGQWLQLGAVATTLGVSQQSLNDWAHKGVVKTQQRRRHGKRFVMRLELVALAKREPWRFGGCDADALFLVLEDRELADEIAASYPFRPNTRRAVRCVTLGREWASTREAGKAVNCAPVTIQKAIQNGRRALGMEWEWVA